MACSLTTGRGIDCRDSIGGIKAIFFTENYCDNILANATVTGDSYIITDADFADWSIVSAATSKVTLLRYNLVTDLSSMTVAVSADKATGSVMYNQRRRRRTCSKLDCLAKIAHRFLCKTATTTCS